MSSISISHILTIVFVLIVDWYRAYGIKFLKGKASIRPVFTDSEVIKLMMAQDYISYPSKMQYIEFIRANYLPLLP